MELCIQFAKTKHNRSVDQIADLMGLTNKWSIYKWIENGNLPSRLIRPFEHACGCDFITRYLAHSAHKLLIDIPTGRPAKDTDLIKAHDGFSTSMKLLMAFYQGQAGAEETIGALTSLMEDVAWHRGNVEKHLTPEFDFGGTHESY
ncbi:MAG: hypothetical protein AB1513_12035 [Pseudomonadota bacterium]